MSASGANVGEQVSTRARTEMKLSRGFYLQVVGLFLLGAFFAWIPAIYTLSASVPPYEQLKVTEGVVSFTTTVRQGRGAGTRLTDDNGETFRFSCKDFAIERGPCLAPEHNGKRAVVRWYWLRTHIIENIRRPVEITIDGEKLTFVTYQKAVESLDSARSWAIGMVILWSLLFLGGIVYELRKEKKRHASQHR